jgi:hypothetical protein
MCENCHQFLTNDRLLTGSQVLGFVPTKPHPQCSAKLDSCQYSPIHERIELQVDIPVTLEREEVTHSLSLHQLPQTTCPPCLIFSIFSNCRSDDLRFPVFPRITLPWFSLSIAGIHKMLVHCLNPERTTATRKSGSALPDSPGALMVS